MSKISFNVPLAIGTTYRHWAKIVSAHLAWAHYIRQINAQLCDEARKQLNALNLDIPEPSFIVFRNKAITILPRVVGRIISEIPEGAAIHISEKMIIKENNENAIKKFYKYRDNLRKCSIYYKEVFQLLDNKKVTTVGYEFAMAYSNLKELLENLIHSRRYVESINNDTNLSDIVQTYDISKWDYIAKELDLFNLSSFTSANQNWFLENLKNLAHWAKGVINYINALHHKKQAKLESNILKEAFASSTAVINFHSHQFEIDLNTYTDIFIQFDKTLYMLDEIITSMKLDIESIESQVPDIDKSKYLSFINSLYAKIFDTERKREVIDKVFYEAPEIDNMIYRVAEQLNNEYRNETTPVCCVGFTEGCIVFLGKIFTLLNFPCAITTMHLSFYGASDSINSNKTINIEFDNSRYDGRRVIVFDDILCSGFTIKEFLRQAREKTKAIDFKICVLFVKPTKKNEYRADFKGCDIPDNWVIGYGFDYLYEHRNIDAIGTIKEKTANITKSS